MEDEKFFVGQKAFVEKNGEILVLTDPIEGLDFPGGKMQVGEKDVTAALKREVLEESGLSIEVGEPFYTRRYVFPKSSRHPGQPVFLVAYRCKYISGEMRLSDEHSQYRWVDKNNFHEVNDGTTFFKMLEVYYA